MRRERPPDDSGEIAGKQVNALGSSFAYVERVVSDLVKIHNSRANEGLVTLDPVAAETALRETRTFLANGGRLEKVIFICLAGPVLSAYQSAIAALKP